MNTQLSEKLNAILSCSREKAKKLGSREITIGHVLLSIIDAEDDRGARNLLKIQNFKLHDLRHDLEKALAEPTPMPVDDEPVFHSSTMEVIKKCLDYASRQKLPEANSLHLISAILTIKPDEKTEKVMKKYNIDEETIWGDEDIETSIDSYIADNEDEALSDITDGLGFDDDDEDEFPDPPSGGPSGESGSASAGKRTKSGKKPGGPGSDTPAIDKFGTDITAAAEEGALDPVVGRHQEIERIAQILCRRKKNNPILIGEPGVGKTAIVEGLALRIVEKKVSRMLHDKRVIHLDMPAIVAGTKYRGQFEERLNAIIKELSQHPEIIIFIDEIHTLIGAGSAAGSMDAANMLKPALSRGQIQCIGATTTDEYRKSIEKDGALERRFQKIMVDPTTPEETLEILNNIKDKYEDHHNVNYSPEALEACVRLTDRFISSRHFPDKAIDAMDEAGSRVHLCNIDTPENILEQEKLINEMREKKHEAVRSQNFELAANFRDKERQEEIKLDALRQHWEEEMKENRETVGEKEIEEVVSMMSGVPVHRIGTTEMQRLRTLSDDLSSKVIGQDEAIHTISRAIRRNRLGLRDRKRPVGCFMFVGPTGVGKTYLAQQLAQHIFGTQDSLIRIDMGEYTQDFSTSRLIGAPPGYVGYDEGGQLTEQVRRKPYSIVLLDEIEKAHQKVYNLLLQLMDEGRLTDSTGRTVDFKNTIIIMTSNVGSRELKEFGRGVGFLAIKGADTQANAKEIVRKELKKKFAPEFINRLDDIVNFNQLKMDDLLKIVKLELTKLTQRVRENGINLTITPAAREYVAKEGYDIEYGARPLKRSIQKNIEDPLTDYIIDHELTAGELTADIIKEKITIISGDEAQDS